MIEKKIKFKKKNFFSIFENRVKMLASWRQQGEWPASSSRQQQQRRPSVHTYFGSSGNIFSNVHIGVLGEAAHDVRGKNHD